MTYNIQEQDKRLILAFMSGGNVTAPLKSDHPYLGTTATRTNGMDVVVEGCGRDDVPSLYGRKTISDGLPVKNPGFDATLLALVSALITETGILSEPYDIAAENLSPR